ncbi:MAG: response regulator [Cyanobacteria bacterium P01_F01_bin.150]
MKHIQFLKTMKRLCFSGQLILTDQLSRKWIIYFSKGHIVHATGGTHVVRRWQRNLKSYGPDYLVNSIVWKRDLCNESESTNMGWEYSLLSFWLDQDYISYKQIKKIIFHTVVEILFDLAQAKDITENIQLKSPLQNPLVSIDVAWVITAFKRQWRIWEGAGLTHVSPNQAPIICNQEKFNSRKAAQFYQSYIKLINGKKSLRDLSVEIQKDVNLLTSKFLPLMDLGWIQLTEIADLSSPISEKISNPKCNQVHQKLLTEYSKKNSSKLIACVDDSLSVHYVMKKLITAAGYKFLGIDDSLRAIGILINRKPELLFLDLVMPNASGYEICKKLRKLPSFNHIPIIILTGNDGFKSRLHSNFVGASDFLSKPLSAEKVLGTINKYLN